MAEDRRVAPRGLWTVLALFVFGALFLGGLFLFTRGRRAPPPPETRTPQERLFGK